MVSRRKLLLPKVQVKKKNMLSHGELEKAVGTNPSHQRQLEISRFEDLFTSHSDSKVQSAFVLLLCI